MINPTAQGKTLRRINVIGTSGSGKSVFSRRLAAQLAVPYIELDSVHWQANWTELNTPELISKMRAAMADNAWVLDGNYSKTNGVKWEFVDTLIWLDFGFWVTFRRILLRSFKRAWSKQEIWPGTGNTESFRRSFFSSESVILWMLTNYKNTKRKYTALFANQDMAHINCIRLTSPTHAEQFLAGLPNKEQ